MFRSSPVALRKAGAVTITAVATVFAAAAPSASAVDSSVNAALRYWRAWSLMTPELRDAVNNAAKPTGGAAEIPEAVASQIGDAEGLVNSLLRAANMPECDFGIDYDLGINALLPHLGPLRTSARLLALDADLHLNEHDHAAAAERIAAIYAMAAHLGQERTLISALVSVAVFTTADEVAIRAEKQGVFRDPAARRTVREALNRLDPQDPFNVLGGLGGERDIYLTWMQEQYKGERGGARLIDELGPFAEENTDQTRSAVEIRDAESLDVYFVLLRAYYDQVFEAWLKDDAADRLRELEGNVKKGEFGPLAVMFAPALSRANAQDRRARDMYLAAKARVAE